MPNPKPSVAPAKPERDTSPSRRNFIKNGGMMLAGGAIAGSTLSVAQSAHAIGNDTIKLGLIGCGGRGTGAAIQALNTLGGGVKLVAMADAFKNNLQTAYRTIKGVHPNKVDVDDRRLAGLDGYKQVMDSDANFVIFGESTGLPSAALRGCSRRRQACFHGKAGRN